MQKTTVASTDRKRAGETVTELEKSRIRPDDELSDQREIATWSLYGLSAANFASVLTIASMDKPIAQLDNWLLAVLILSAIAIPWNLTMALQFHPSSSLSSKLKPHHRGFMRCYLIGLLTATAGLAALFGHFADWFIAIPVSSAIAAGVVSARLYKS